MAISSLKKRTALGCAVVGLLIAGPAFAQQREFNVPAQDARQAIPQFARQAGVQISAPTGRLRSVRTRALRGNLDVRAALRAMIEGTGLSIASDNGSMIVLRYGSSESGEAQAGGAAVDNESAEHQTITVTGTNIRGAPPVGAAPTVLDRRAIEATGYATVEQVIQTLPQNFPGGQNESTQASASDKGGNTTVGSSINLRGLGADATLTLLNGRRLPGAGSDGSFVDISMIPLSAVERIEILPDGASAIYGSDAIGGVVNILLRRSFQGLETNIRYGHVTEGDLAERSFSQLAGFSWGSGSLLGVYEYYDRGNLLATERDFAASTDLRRFGGSDFSREFSNPGTITRIGTTTVSLAIPGGQDGTNLRESDLLAGPNRQNRNEQVDLLADQDKHGAYAALRQDIGDRIELTADAGYSRRRALLLGRHGSTSLTVPQSNAYRQLNNLFPGRGNLTIAYYLIDDLGPITSDSLTESWFANIGASLQLGDGWLARLNGQYARQRAEQSVFNIQDSPALNAALASSNLATAFNPFADGSNTSQAVLNGIRATQRFGNDAVVRTLTVLADGPLVTLGGQEIRVAVGGEYREESFEALRSDISVGGVVEPQPFPPPGARNVVVAFAEMRVPVVSPDRAVNGVHALELSGSLRWERYSDFGATTNPRFGINWSPTSFLTLRGSWGLSFRAPRFDQLRGTANITIASVPPTIDPLATGGSTISITILGGNPDLVPERARSWTAGVELRPAMVRDLSLYATYFDIAYEGRIARPATSTADAFRRSDQLPGVFIRNPDAATITRYLAVDTDGVFTGLPPVGIEAIVDLRLTNLASLDVRGIDFGANFTRMLPFGQLSLAVNGTYLIDYLRQTNAVVAPTDIAGTINNPVDLRVRASASLSSGPVSATLAVNHTGSYTDTISIPQRSIAAWTTVDAQVSFDLAPMAPVLRGTSLRLAVTNLFDTDPPFVNDPAGLGFDSVNVNPLGRFVTVSLRRSW